MIVTNRDQQQEWHVELEYLENRVSNASSGTKKEMQQRIEELKSRLETPFT